jgi:hypothetical protein
MVSSIFSAPKYPQRDQTVLATADPLRPNEVP